MQETDRYPDEALVDYCARMTSLLLSQDEHKKRQMVLQDSQITHLEVICRDGQRFVYTPEQQRQASICAERMNGIVVQTCNGRVL